MIGPTVTATIQSLTTASNGIGGYTQTWTSLGSFTGILIATERTKETLTAGKETVISTHNFYMDYKSGVTITATCKLVYGSRTFDITFVNNLAEMDRYIILDLVEIV